MGSKGTQGLLKLRAGGGVTLIFLMPSPQNGPKPTSRPMGPSASSLPAPAPLSSRIHPTLNEEQLQRSRGSNGESSVTHRLAVSLACPARTRPPASTPLPHMPHLCLDAHVCASPTSVPSPPSEPSCSASVSCPGPEPLT